jgi:hypothetical protein
VFGGEHSCTYTAPNHAVSVGNLSNEVEHKISHIRPQDTLYIEEDFRNFFEYRDLGVAAANGGNVIAHLVRAKNPPEKGARWHVHEANFQILVMCKGWTRFVYEGKDTLVSRGDCVQEAPGIRRFSSTTQTTWNTSKSSVPQTLIASLWRSMRSSTALALTI